MIEKPLLSVKNLRVTFSEKRDVTKKIVAVNDISFNVAEGEIVGIVGESGSGKSVTSLSLMRLLGENAQVQADMLLFQGKDLTKATENEMCHIRGKEMAMIFQEPMTSLNPVYTCGHQVAEAITIHQKCDTKEAKRQTIAIFEKVKLPDTERAYNAYPHQLSGGQKQRVMIAMALANSPKLLIADEPTTALDVTVQKNILLLIKELQKETQTSVLFITHDLGVIAEIADRVVVMYKGKIVEEGSVKNIFETPQHPYTKSLLACRPPLDFRLSRLPVVNDFMTATPNAEGYFTIEEKPNSVAKALAAVRVSAEETAEHLQNLMAKQPILKVENLRTWFPKTTNWFGKPLDYVKAVDDVSFEVYEGETLGLVGESGCGKTTLGRTLLRLNPANSGKIWFEGKDILALSEKEMREQRKEMQIIFQDPYSSLNPRMSIGNAILEPMQVHHLYNNDRERKERVINLLETVNLSADHFHRYPHEFSGGQRQRICIARALALNPRFVICDESVSALDVSVQAQVLNLLVELKEKMKFTCIFISHDLSVVKFISDRIAVMNKGKIEELAPADALYASPKSDYTKKLIAAIPNSLALLG